MHTTDAFEKNTIQTNNMDKTYILPAGILALALRDANRILSAAHYMYPVWL
jgi:hypothetical protein